MFETILQVDALSSVRCVDLQVEADKLLVQLPLII
jgi:hypothetical protein